MSEHYSPKVASKLSKGMRRSLLIREQNNLLKGSNRMVYIEISEILQSFLISGAIAIIHRRHILQLSVLNKQCNQRLFNYICTTFTFEKKGIFQHYLPHKVICASGAHQLKNLPITHLRLGTFFNEPVDELPATVTHISFGYCFNQPVEYLPPNLTHLTFGFSFNQSIDHLPKSVSHLVFGCSFDQPVNQLPPNISHITFGPHYNLSVEHLAAKTPSIIIGHKDEFGRETIGVKRKEPEREKRIARLPSTRTLQRNPISLEQLFQKPS